MCSCGGELSVWCFDCGDALGLDQLCDNGVGLGGAINTSRGLTPTLDLGEEGLAMKATRTCSVHGCEKDRKHRSSMCSMHHARKSRTGRTDLFRKLRTTEQDAQRFWSKVDLRGPNECWPFSGTIIRPGGYGQFTAQGRCFTAHRYAYEIAIGPIPDGLTIDHVRARGCIRRDCVNPAHLEPVTAEENTRRAWLYRRSSDDCGCTDDHEAVSHA